MNANTNFRMPARRFTATAAATVLAAGPVVLTGAGSAHASTDHGRASAVVLRTGLDVSLLNKTVNVPLAVSLNEVRAPGSAERTALTARLDGVDGGQPFSVLRADVASAKATVTASGAEASTNLTHARIHVPGLPLLSLIEVGQVTSKATCEAGRKPVASATLLGGVTVLGKKVTLTVGGPTEVKVPGVGEVRIDFSKTRTTSRTAAASALELRVSVNPLKLNVADVEGTLTLGSVSCESPAAAPVSAPASAPASVSAPDIKPQGASAESGLAETGGTSTTPFVVGAAVVLLAAGGAAVALGRRRRS
ncbi:SCO1860 family LAETG-anchored protein [Streptomyces sp. NBC_00268]|uniref:SCO1860 family LAETG-anchored protein n=1 Tax=Streptomyces sp. NBC_00268 TaxID=2975695 RepID=UPI00225BE897|nr:SCO1860 family LAETG-anchored protein [Streptomyces sp. NBC_00268]MCX5183743.1 LPXTG cell wall anchor domain-containing protein [Streptomyces sp. NBC_00268]